MRRSQKNSLNRRVLIIGKRRRAVMVLPPSAPVNLFVEPTETYLYSAWEDTAGNEDGFRLYRRAFDDPFQVVAEMPANQTEFYDGNVDMGVIYTYYVVAFNAGGESAPSNEAAGELTIAA